MVTNMAQTGMKDFFGTRKRPLDHPSKKRKIESVDLLSKVVDNTSETINDTDITVKNVLDQNATSAESKRRQTPRRATQKATTSMGTRSSARKKQRETGQLKIQDAFIKASGCPGEKGGLGVSRNIDLEHSETVVTEEATSYWDEHDGSKTPKRKTLSSTSVEPPVSDTRVIRTARRKTQTQRKEPADSITPKKDGLVEVEKNSRKRSVARNFSKLLEASSHDLSQKASDDKDVVALLPAASSHPDKHAVDSEGQSSTAKMDMPSDEEIQRILGPSNPVPISPLPATPQNIHCKSAKPVGITSPKMKASVDKLKHLQEDDGVGNASETVANVAKGAPGTVTECANKASESVKDSEESVAEIAVSNTEKAVELVASSVEKTSGIAAQKASKKQRVIPTKVMREQLAKCGKLDDLKAKLAEMNSSLKAVRKMEADRNLAEAADKEEVVGKPVVKEKITSARTQTGGKPTPAFERYEHLAREGPPTLALPGKYQHLLNMFQGTDTVVSMLFNRQEVITYSKLKTAVQSMTRKNFEQKTLGQMKTVYPDAYSFRQEKGLPSFGQKVSGYQLTVEPSLEGLGEGDNASQNGKPNMSASVLLKRKRIFHNTLIDITKNHHADFLSRQDPPLQVPAAKLTRWHPCFALDSVPDVEPAELPSPPVKAIQTAKQVLESVKGKLPARVEEAMARVAMKSESTQLKVTSAQQQNPASVASTSKPTSSAYKGIPPALLEKIRAKQAAKAQAALMRDPKEDKKTEMIRRLPNLIRSLRTFYVTEKKPSLPYKTVVEKLADSYDTFISPVVVETHLTLLQELAPKWLQVIQIARGKYIKIDKNMDISALIKKLTDLAESRE